MLKNRNRQMTGGCVLKLHREKKWLSVVILALALLQTTGALAQEPAPAPTAPANPTPAPTPATPKPVATPTITPKPEALKAATATPVAAAAPSASEKTEEIDIFDDPLKEEISEYWSTEGRSLETLANRIYSKAGRFAASLVFGMEPTDPFWLYLTPGLRLDYYFSEYSGIELSLVSTLPIKKALNANFNDIASNKGRAGFGQGDPLYGGLFDKSLFRVDVAYVWTPFYGKLGLLSKKLIHFDMNFVAGLGLNGVMRPDINHLKAPTFTMAPEIFLGMGASFFFTQNWGVRIDGRSFFTISNKTSDKDSFGSRISFPVEFTVGGTYTF